jgi:hypothetical protein
MEHINDLFGTHIIAGRIPSSQTDAHDGALEVGLLVTIFAFKIAVALDVFVEPCTIVEFTWFIVTKPVSLE